MENTIPLHHAVYPLPLVRRNYQRDLVLDRRLDRLYRRQVCHIFDSFQRRKDTKVQAQLAWKPDRPRLSVKPKQLTALAFEIYKDMSRYEDHFAIMSFEDDRANMFNEILVKDNRNSIVAFSKSGLQECVNRPQRPLVVCCWPGARG